jgi:hypothetical protein
MIYTKPVRFADASTPLAKPSILRGKRRFTADVAFLLRMPAGIPGDVNRAWASVVEPQVITPSTAASGAPTTYGVPVVPDGYLGTAVINTAGQMRTILTSDSGSAVQGIFPYGILVRPFPTQSPNWPNDPLGTSTPPTSGACDVLKAGYVAVLLTGSTAAVKGGQVYVYTSASSGANVLGGITASATNAVAWGGAYFTGAADASGNVEIAINP